MAPSSAIASLLLVAALGIGACAAPAEGDVGDASGAASKGDTSDPMNQPVRSHYFGTIRSEAGKRLDGVTIVGGCPTLAKPTLAKAEDLSEDGGDYHLVFKAPKVTTCEAKLVKDGKDSRRFLLIAGPPSLQADIYLQDDGTLRGVQMIPE